MKQRFEHLAVQDIDVSKATLGFYEYEGWELVSVTQSRYDIYTLFFKRPFQELIK